ncbi:MAG: hypothetical protein EOP50_00430 [Sphingobacteriales bacterium]|nr:MAG: hypothetical protein EOP50_00430 [Sphingobacteriales bacterium]
MRLNEARELLNVISAAENAAGPLKPISSFEASLRGLFYVSCYGALEWAVTTGVRAYLTAIDDEKIPFRQLDWVFNSVALDSFFKAVTDTGYGGKWAARRRMFEAFADGTHCQASTASMDALLSNIWPKTIEEIFQCFGIVKPWTNAPAHLGYMRELVGKRNEVAHGRLTATEAGEGTTFTQLDKIHKATSGVALYFLATLEDHAKQKLYVQPAFRVEYLNAN